MPVEKRCVYVCVCVMLSPLWVLPRACECVYVCKGVRGCIPAPGETPLTPFRRIEWGHTGATPFNPHEATTTVHSQSSKRPPFRVDDVCLAKRGACQAAPLRPGPPANSVGPADGHARHTQAADRKWHFSKIDTVRGGPINNSTSVCVCVARINAEWL